MDVPTYPSFEVLTSSEARERTPGLKVDPEKLALREERELVRTFKERLDFNAGVTGTSLKRERVDESTRQRDRSVGLGYW